MFKKILSIVSALLVAIVIWQAWPEIIDAEHELHNMNIWILLLLIPVQALMFYSAGKFHFSYLRVKGKLQGESSLGMMRVGLEINFVNHVIPSGGVSGLGYMAWRLRKFGVSGGQVTIMYFLRYALVAVASTAFIIISALYLWLSGAPLLPVLVSLAIGFGMLFVVLVVFFVLSRERRVHAFGKWASRVTNRVVRLATFGKVAEALKEAAVDKYLGDLRRDFVELKRDRRKLKTPFIWAGIYALMDSGTFWIAFLALGAGVPIFPVIVAQAFASIIGTVVVTPGGAGFYEATMIWFFVSVGVDPATAIVATLVTRVAVMLGTILTGWGFYQAAISHNEGKGKLRFSLPRIIRRKKAKDGQIKA